MGVKIRSCIEVFPCFFRWGSQCKGSASSRKGEDSTCRRYQGNEIEENRATIHEILLTSKNINWKQWTNYKYRRKRSNTEPECGLTQTHRRSGRPIMSIVILYRLRTLHAVTLIRSDAQETGGPRNLRRQ